MKKARSLVCLLLAVMLGGLAGCAHKPPYSEMDANRQPSNQNQNRNIEGQSAASTATSGAPSKTEPAQQSPAPPPPAAIKSPSFLDQAKGEIKDLPAYPRSYRVSAQVGPMQGVNTMSLGLKSADPMEKIAAFYERVIKDNNWTVIDKLIDPELSEWTLKKGEEHSAKVQIKKDLQTGAMNIVIVRGEKMSGERK